MDVNKQNPTSRPGQNGVDKNVHQDKLNNLKATEHLPLTQEQIDELLDSLPARAFQAKRFVKYVAEKPNSKTADCNVAVAGVNLSDIARKYNPYIRPKGFELMCKLPEKLIKNRFGEDTMQHFWRLAEVSQGGAYGE